VTPAYELLTFDCYGTLIDWETGIAEAFREAASRDGVTLERDAVLAAHAEVEPVVQREAFRPYRDVLARTAVEVGRRLGWAIGIERGRFLPESLPHWPVFPDTNAALRRLAAAGLELGILSNVDDDLIAATLRRLDAPFAFIVTAQQAQAYKPTPAHFIIAAERVAGRRWLHVAQSWFHDVVPASGRRIPVLWVNRKGEAAAADARPVGVVRDLADAASWLLD
jgi:2-haloacid dehalogenase/putative hydrolase of the HAD superfamily